MDQFNLRTAADPLPFRAHRVGRRYPFLAVDPDGLVIVHVPLASGQVATAEARDFKELMLSGLSDQWQMNRDGKRGANGEYHWYVRAAGGGTKMVMVARRILGDRGRTRVRYRDGNPLNLRRSNLYMAALYAPPMTEATASVAAVTHW